MGKKNEIAQQDSQMSWTINDPAPKTEMADFWKKLRHFYRTSEKPKGEKPGKLTSAIRSELNDDTPTYPFILDNDQGLSIEFGPKVPFQMLNYLLAEHQKENRKKFKDKLQELIYGLSKLLSGDGGQLEALQMEETYDFANEIMAFDKLAGLVPKRSNEKLTQHRLDRLQIVTETLNKGLNYFSDQHATVIGSKSLIKRFDLDKTLENVRLIPVGHEDAFARAQKEFVSQMELFTSLIKAYRIAVLEVEGNYQDDIHNEYFTHFTWHRLLGEELALFHPLLLMVEQEYLIERLTTFTKLISYNQPIKIVAVNTTLVSEPDKTISWEDASHQFRQELASVAISQRNTYTFQADIDDPSIIYNGLLDCLKSISPGMCHLLLSDHATPDHFQIKAATAGRYFPGIMYDPNKGAEWGSRFDLSGNVQPDKKWPLYTLKAKTSKETEAMIDVAFTYADYKAVYPSKANELMLIPSAYYSEHLVPLNDYLDLQEESLYGKIPYIWLIDENNELHRAAVPNVWVVSCQERLDFWSYLKELGGNAREGMEAKQEKMQKAFAEEKEQIEKAHQQELAKIKEEAIGNAAERLISVLLDDEEISLESLAPEQPVDRTITASKKETKEADQKEDIQPENTNSEPWVDSINCTSCNECTDLYPNLFKYNEDKQAYLTDPTKGTFAELVKAAEKCPADCIHPGMPLNQNEANLDKLIKRAEKFD